MRLLGLLLSVILLTNCQKETSTLEIDTAPQTTADAPEANVEERVLVWSDEFEGASLNMDNWSFELGDGCPFLCGWGNNELQVYTDENHKLEDGMLVISAKKDSEGNYTSTRIITKGKREFQYGRIETRVKVATGAGLWPAFWALGSSIDTTPWPDCGEIDIMEYVGRKPGEVFTSVHTRSSFGNTVNTQTTPYPNIEDDFHVYAIEWNDTFIEFFLDDNRIYRYAPQFQNQENWPFDQPVYLLINLAIGGNFGGAVSNSLDFPRAFYIDYVRVYQ